MIKVYWMFIGMLAVWRITHLLYAEDGPWDLLVRLRKRAGQGFWAQLLDCFYCLSLWTAIPPAWLMGESWTERVILWPALSGGAILLERIASRGGYLPPAVYQEDEEEPDGMLRTTQTARLTREPDPGETGTPQSIGGTPP